MSRPPQGQSTNLLTSSTSFSAYSRSRYELDSDSSSTSFLSGSTLSRSSRQPDSRKSALTTSFHLRLVSQLSPSSELYPISSSRLEQLKLFLPLLDQFVNTISEKMQDVDASVSMGKSSALENGKLSNFGKSFGFELERLLKVLHEALEDSRKSEEEHPEEERQETGDVMEEVKARLEVILINLLRTRPRTRGLKNALILSLVQTISLVSPSSSGFQSEFAPGTLLPLLEYLNASLFESVSQDSFDTNVRLFVLRTLILLPIEAWTGAESASTTLDRDKGKGKAKEAVRDSNNCWGHESWRIIFDGLRDRDETLRKATIHLLSRVDRNLLNLQYSKLLDTIPSSPLEQARSKLLLQLLELLPYTSSSTSDPLPSQILISPSRFISPDRLVELLRNPTLDITPKQVIPDLVLKVLYEFRYHFSPAEQRRFAMELWKLGESKAVAGNDWSWRGNIMFGLLMAGTIHSAAAGKEMSESGGSVKMAEELSRWLTDDQVDREVKEMLSEPFLFALLRIVALSFQSTSSERASSRLNPETSPGIASIQDSISNLATKTTQALDPSLLSIARRALESEESLSKLSRVGEKTETESLAEFGQALSRAFTLESTFDYHQTLSASSVSPRAPYRDNAPIQQTSGSYSKASSDSTIREKRGEERIEEISRSIAALKREQAELRRERKDRGGTTGSVNGKVESLMERETVRERGSDEKEVFSVSDEGDEDGEADESVDRERETTVSTDGNGGNEPPSSLLIELTETLDPFHIH
ncbi:hypothetical protein JCM5350_004625 [Sporobolomyces pararoseus]